MKRPMDCRAGHERANSHWYDRGSIGNDPLRPGLLIILALLFLVPGFPALLATIIFKFVELITLPFDEWTDLQLLLQYLLFG